MPRVRLMRILKQGRRTVVVLTLSLVMIALTASEAAANVQATQCFNRMFSGQSLEVCVSVNEHKSWHWHEGHVVMHGNALVWIDYIRIFRNGAQQDGNTYPSWYPPFTGFTTDWDTGCTPGSSWFARARYRFKVGNNVSGFFVDRSLNLNEQGCG